MTPLEADPAFINIFINLAVTFYPVSPGILTAIFVVILLLYFSAMISGSEVAYFSLTPANKKDLSERKSPRSKLVLEHLEEPERLLATILIANNFVNVGIVIISAFVIDGIVDFSTSRILEFLAKVIIVTFILLLFGEILPKIYANRFPVRFSRSMAKALKVMEVLFRPLSQLLVSSTTLVNRRLARKSHDLSMDELSEALELTSDQITDERQLLEGIVKFGNIAANEIMTPRTDVVAADIKTPWPDLIQLIKQEGFSRIPIYEDSFDKIRGILYVKDLLPHLNKRSNFNWQSLIRPPYFVPETKKISDLLKEFQSQKIHMALVVDEYGGTSGIVTLEDTIEEIVGEITDEWDEEERMYKKLDEKTYLFDGKIQLNDFYKITDSDPDIFDPVKGDADTLAGLILELRGAFPEQNDVLSYKNFTFTVESVDKRRIRQIRTRMERRSPEQTQ